MTITNTPNQVTPLVLEQARSFALRMSFLLADDTVVNLTGGTITFTMLQPVRQGTAVVLTKDATLVSPDAGYAVLDLQAAELDLAPAVYPYSITYIDADDYSATVVKGEVQILSNTDPQTANVYDVSALDIELGFDNVVVTVNHLQAPTLQIGTVTTVPYGNPAGAGIRGGYPHQLLDLVLPKGAPGGSAEAYDEAFSAAVAQAAAMDAPIQAELDAYEASNDAALWNTYLYALQVQTNLNDEATARANADSAETTARQNADAAITAAMATDAELAAHAAATATHGVGTIVGRTEAQALTNKDLTAISNTFPSWLMPIGTILEWPGLTAPFGYLMADGAAVSRATYPFLWNAVTYQWNSVGAVAAGQKVITMADTSKAKVGMVVDGPGCGVGNVIASISTNVSITLTSNITVASVAGTAFRLAPWGNGDGSTTFNTPNRSGKTAFGVDGSAEFDRLGRTGGMKDHTHLGVDHLHGGVDHLHGIFLSGSYAGGGSRTASNASATQGADRSLTTGAADRNLTTSGANNGTTALNPYVALNFIVRAA